jgi:hypothetical protein
MSMNVERKPAGQAMRKSFGTAQAQEHRIDVEEVHGEDRLRLGLQERPPGLPGPPGRGIDAGVFKDLPYRRRGQLVPETGQLTVDAAVSPACGVPKLRHVSLACHFALWVPITGTHESPGSALTREPVSDPG